MMHCVIIIHVRSQGDGVIFHMNKDVMGLTEARTSRGAPSASQREEDRLQGGEDSCTEDELSERVPLRQT